MRNQKGFTLIEVLVALVLMGLISVVCLNGLVIAFKSNIIADEQTTALSLAQSQIEYTKRYPYNPEAVTYPYAYIYDEIYNPIPITLPETYGISVAVSPAPEGDINIQKITVTIKRHGDEVTSLEAYKVNRE